MAEQLAKLKCFARIQAIRQASMEFRCPLGKLAKKNQPNVRNENQYASTVLIVNDTLYKTSCNHSVNELGHGWRIHAQLLGQLTDGSPSFVRKLVKHPPLLCRCANFTQYPVQLSRQPSLSLFED